MPGQLFYSTQIPACLWFLAREHLPDAEVWAYGSRVNGRCHGGSDLDLVLRGPGFAKIPAEQMADFSDAVYESTIPCLVEARDWARLPQGFQREIEREHMLFAGPPGWSPRNNTGVDYRCDHGRNDR